MAPGDKSRNEEKAYHSLTLAKLEEAKPKIRLFGLDYDGTVSDGTSYKHPQVFALVERILDKGKSVAFITARASTALKTLVPPLQELLVENNINTPQFIAGGNGTTLYGVQKDKLVIIYNYGLNLSHVQYAVNVGEKVFNEFKIRHNDLVKKGLESFKKFLRDDWGGYIPHEIVNVCRPYNGELFTEEAKVSFVLPKNKSLHLTLIKALNDALGVDYQALAGDDIYVHITRRLKEDSKAMAIKTILELMGLNQTQVVTFGDMPKGNDSGLLSFPYSFTNSDEYIIVKTDIDKPPYILIDPKLSPVARVYEAVDYLLE